MDFETYRRTGRIEARPYQPGEDLTGVSVSETDAPNTGGMICRDPENPEDQWYVNREYFEAHYAPGLPFPDETPEFDSYEQFRRAFGLREDRIAQYIRSYVKSFHDDGERVHLVLADWVDLCLVEVLALIEDFTGQTWEEKLLEEARLRIKAFRQHRAQKNQESAELETIIRQEGDVMILAGTEPTYEWLSDAADRHDLNVPIEQSPLAKDE